jgi:hypothetical protein
MTSRRPLDQHEKHASIDELADKLEHHCLSCCIRTFEYDCPTWSLDSRRRVMYAPVESDFNDRS